MWWPFWSHCSKDHSLPSIPAFLSPSQWNSGNVLSHSPAGPKGEMKCWFSWFLLRTVTLWETWVRSLVREDPLEKEMAPHSSTLAWKIPWTEEPGRLQSIGLHRVGHDWATALSRVASGGLLAVIAISWLVEASPGVLLHFHVVLLLCACVCSHVLFLKGHLSYWIRNPLHSSMTSCWLITSAVTLLPCKVTFWATFSFCITHIVEYRKIKYASTVTL